MVAHVHTPSDLGGTMSGPVVKINKDLELDGALVLVCFPSVGMVSSIVAHYFIDNLDLKFVGGVVDERLLHLLGEGWCTDASHPHLCGGTGVSGRRL